MTSSSVSRRRFRFGLALAVASCTTALARDGGPVVIARLAAVLDAPALPVHCERQPPTPNPDGAGDPLTQCTAEREGAQFVTLRTDHGRTVWLDYTGPWRSAARARAEWTALVESLTKAMNPAPAGRGDCLLWSRDDGSLRVTLQSAGATLRVRATASDTRDALGC